MRWKRRSAKSTALWAARHTAGYLDDIALTTDDYHTLAKLSEPARSRQLFHRALDDLRADPTRYARLCLRRLRYFVFFDETNPKTRSIVYRTSHLALTLLAAVGLIRAGRKLLIRLTPTILVAGLITALNVFLVCEQLFG